MYRPRGRSLLADKPCTGSRPVRAGECADFASGVRIGGEPCTFTCFAAEQLVAPAPGTTRPRRRLSWHFTTAFWGHFRVSATEATAVVVLVPQPTKCPKDLEAVDTPGATAPTDEGSQRPRSTID